MFLKISIFENEYFKYQFLYKERRSVKITILTMFPELFGDFLKAPVIARAIDRRLAEVHIVDIRQYAKGSYRHLDDSTFGGGAGMVMRVQPVRDALLDVCMGHGDSHFVSFPLEAEQGDCRRASEKCSRSPLRIALTPAGTPYNQAMARELSQEDEIVLLCGHYEGMDARIFRYIDREISIGDYVLTGGELASQVIVDSILRLLPGVLRAASTENESFENGLLEYPQYTQPADFEGDKVPEVLLSGNHEKIRKWRLKESLRLTLERRPDLLEGREFTEEEKEILEEIRS